jgi:hypothetical protein
VGTPRICSLVSSIHRTLLFCAVLAAPGACNGQTDDDGQDASGDPDGAIDEERDETVDGEAPAEALAWTAPENISMSAALSDIRFQWGRSLAAGEDGKVHAAWREVRGEQDTLDLAAVVYRMRDGLAWTPVQEIAPVAAGSGHPKLALSGSHVYILWHRHDPAGEDSLLLSVSDAGGAAGTFSPPRTLVSDAAVTTLNPMGEYATAPSIAAWGDWVYIVWSDERMVDACGMQVPEVYLLSSPDRGETWSAVLPVSSQDCRSSWTPAVAAWGGVVHVAWTDERHNASDCGLTGGMCHEEEYYRRLADNGSTPDPVEVRLTHDEPGSEVESWGPSIAAWDGNVQIAWYDRAGGNDFEVYHIRSMDSGLSWESEPRRLSMHAPGCLSACATLASEAEAVHVVWFEMCGDAASTVLHTWSDDLGETWSGVSDVTSGGGVLAVHPHVALGSGRPHVVWNDNADGEIYYAAPL